jgi:hypothetical protein
MCPLTWLSAFALLLGCGTESTDLPSGLAPLFSASEDDAPQFSAWSEPVNLGAVVNSASNDIEVSISKDGLSLYFASNRPGGVGGFDIWVSQRASENDPWGAPQNLGPTVNSTVRDQAPSLTIDGHRLYFFSDRPGGFGGTDIYVSRRRNKRDDFGWQAPQNLGSNLNTELGEALPVPFEDILFFNSARPGGLGATDVYASMMQPDGTFGPGVLVEELSSSSSDAPCAIRRDGLEFFQGSTRPGANPTFFDLWVATRGSIADSWSTPVNVGAPVNNPPPAGESRCALSFDATTLYIISDRPGGVGGLDIWVSMRSKLKGSD